MAGKVQLAFLLTAKAFLALNNCCHCYAKRLSGYIYIPLCFPLESLRKKGYTKENTVRRKRILKTNAVNKKSSFSKMTRENVPPAESTFAQRKNEVPLGAVGLNTYR